MIDRKKQKIQGILIILVPLLLIVSYVFISNNFIRPKTKFNKPEKYYSGSLKNKSSYNDYTSKSVSIENLINRVFYDFNYKILYNPKEAYGLIKNKNTNKLFSSYDEFEKFISKNREKLIYSKVQKYNLKGKVFTLTDNYKYKYDFEITNPVSYTVSLYK